MEMRRKGYTLMEVVVYAVLSLVALGLIGSILQIMMRVRQATGAAFTVTGQVETTVEWLRRDLEETALATVRTQSTPPMLSLCSARNQDNQLMVSEYGGPRWMKHVFYALRADGNLVRWEVPLSQAQLDSRLPQVAVFPKSIPNQARVMMHNGVQPFHQVGQVQGYRASAWGGFRVQFVRRDKGEDRDRLDDQNPVTQPKEAGSATRLLELELTTADTSKGSTDFYSLKFRVTPRH